MLIKTRGIVFRAIKYGESSLIVDVLTRARGLQKYIIGGVRKKQAGISAGMFQVMSLLDLVAYYRDDRDMHRIKEVRPAYVFRTIPFDVRRGAVGMFMAEVARKTIRGSEQHEALFDFLYDTFCFLDRTEGAVHNLHLYFLLRLSGFLGFHPGDGYDPRQCPFFDLREGIFLPQPPGHVHYLDAGQSQLLDRLLDADAEASCRMVVTHTERVRLLEHLLEYYRLHLEGLPEIHSHLILREVLAG